MIAWKNEADAAGYATSCLDTALDHLQRVDTSGGRLDVLDVTRALEAVADALAAVVVLRHIRQGDALVTIDQLTLETTPAAQPARTCCQTYPAESHASGCYVTASKPIPARVLQGLQ